MILHVSKTPAEVIQSLAEFFIRTAEQSIEANDRFIVSLSGGSSPKALYELLAANYKTAIDWKKVQFFFGDERYVSAEDDRYNGLIVDKALFDPLNIPDENIYKIDTSLDPAESAKDY